MRFSLIGAVVAGIIGIAVANFVAGTNLPQDPTTIVMGFAIVGAIAGAAETVVRANRVR